MNHAETVKLLNGIIAHGNHSFAQYSADQFANMQVVVTMLEDLPTDGIVYIKHNNGVKFNITADNIDIDKEDDSGYQVLFDFGVNFDCEAVELIELYNDIESKDGDYDFYIEFDGNEYRIISADSIWEIYKEDVKNIVEDCYDLKLDNIPDFIAFEIDWEQTAQNAYADGYGHTFSSYDGSESEVCNNNVVQYYIFRTN